MTRRAPVPDELEPLLRALPLFVFVSGGSALAYQSLWMRHFGLVFGNTTRAVSVALAAFMAGLALGSLLAGRRRARRPLRAWALTELGIGTTALVTLPLLEWLPSGYAALVRSTGLAGGLGSLVRALLAGLVVLPTAVLIGATLPLLVEYLTRAAGRYHARFGALYRTGTLGAAAGVLATAFAGLPALGVSGTLIAAALGNLAAGAFGIAWSRRLEATDAADADEATAGPASPARLPAVFGLFALGSGIASFGLEVVWTRSFALVVGSSYYAFSLMLLAFLLGIGLGALIYERTWTRLRAPRRAVGWTAAAIGVAMLLAPALVGTLPGVYLQLLRRLGPGFASQQAAGFGLCLLAMLPLTTAFGFLFPALTHLVREESGSAQRLTGMLYAWNTAGAVGGALLAERLLIPALGLQGSGLALAAAPLAMGAWALAPAAPARRLPAVAAAVAAAAVLAALWRPWNPLVMSSGVHRYGTGWREDVAVEGLAKWLERTRRSLFFEEGREAVVSVAESRATGRRFIAVNGKTEAGDGPEDAFTQRFIAHVPLVLHPAPRRVLVIGWGSGATAGSAALHPVERLECVEIEPATFEAGPLFEKLNRGVWRDPRFRFVADDARSHLLTGEALWDVVVSEPSNPWISGVSNLFTRDFYEIALERLAPGGLFAQWFHYYNLEEQDVRIQIATFAAVFPHASLWLAPPVSGADGEAHLVGDLLLIGSREPPPLDWRRIETAYADEAVAADLSAGGGLVDPVAFLASYAVGGDALRAWVNDVPRKLPLNTDDHPLIELQAPRRAAMDPDDAGELARQIHADLASAAQPLPPVVGWPALEGGPEGRAGALQALAGALLRAARTTQAEGLLEEAVEIDPDATDARLRLAELAWAGADVSAARALLEENLARDPAHVASAETLAGILANRGELESAEAVYRRLLAEVPSHAPGYLQLGALLVRRGELASARDALRRARELDPDLPGSGELLDRVEAALAGS